MEADGLPKPDNVILGETFATNTKGLMMSSTSSVCSPKHARPIHSISG
jgi:hypothetical protein